MWKAAWKDSGTTSFKRQSRSTWGRYDDQPHHPPPMSPFYPPPRVLVATSDESRTHKVGECEMHKR